MSHRGDTWEGSWRSLSVLFTELFPLSLIDNIQDFELFVCNFSDPIALKISFTDSQIDPICRSFVGPSEQTLANFEGKIICRCLGVVLLL